MTKYNHERLTCLGPVIDLILLPNEVTNAFKEASFNFSFSGLATKAFGSGTADPTAIKYSRRACFLLSVSVTETIVWNKPFKIVSASLSSILSE